MATDTGVTQVWSSGGGIQSTAIAVLILQGKLPKPDLSFIVDTGREKQSTWDYAKQYTIPALKAIGVDLEVINKDLFATVDLYGGADDETLLIPAFTTHSGEVGKLPTYCSKEWKELVGNRWLRKVKGVKKCNLWLGISRDEMQRIRQSSLLWRVNHYPLLDLRMNRQDCINTILQYGWPLPERSSCWMCPNQTHSEWVQLRKKRPDDYEKAAVFEQQIRQIDPTLTLTSTGETLDNLPDEPESPQLGLFDEGCTSGFCFV